MNLRFILKINLTLTCQATYHRSHVRSIDDNIATSSAFSSSSDKTCKECKCWEKQAKNAWWSWNNTGHDSSSAFGSSVEKNVQHLFSGNGTANSEHSKSRYYNNVEYKDNTISSCESCMGTIWHPQISCRKYRSSCCPALQIWSHVAHPWQSWRWAGKSQ